MAYKHKVGITHSKVYEDIQQDIFGRKLYSTAYTVDYDWDENAIKFQKDGDISDKNKRVQWNIQLFHAMALGSKSFFKMHFHWWQTTIQATFTLRYRIQYGGEEKTTSWTTITVTTGTTASQGANDIFDLSGKTTGNQITKFAEIDISSCNISDVIQFQLARTDSNTGDVYVTFVDAHIAEDSDGSRSEWTK